MVNRYTAAAAARRTAATEEEIREILKRWKLLSMLWKETCGENAASIASRLGSPRGGAMVGWFEWFGCFFGRGKIIRKILKFKLIRIRKFEKKISWL